MKNYKPSVNNQLHIKITHLFRNGINWIHLGNIIGSFPVPYPAIFGGCQFFASFGSRGKKALENCGYFAFWIAQNIALVALWQRTVTWTAICVFLDELIFTLLRVWGSEFGIPIQYAGFKIALDMALFPFPFLLAVFHKSLSLW